MSAGSGDVAEQRLLKEIAGSQPSQPEGAVRQGPGARESRLQKWMRNLGPKQQGSKKDNSLVGQLKMINTVLWVVLLGFAIFIGLEFYPILLEDSSSGNLAESAPATAARNFQASIADVPGNYLNPIIDYLDTVKERNPFTGEGAIAVQEYEGTVVAVPTKIAERVEGLILVGINRGARPEAFIEDTVEKRTYFVTEGETIRDVLVKEIRFDSIVLGYEDEEVQIG